MLGKQIISNIGYAKQFCSHPFNLVFLIAWGSALLGFWRGINNHIPLLREFTDEIEWVLVLLPILLSLSKLKSYIKTKDVLFVLFCLFIYFANFVIYPENEKPLATHLFIFSCLALPYYFIGVSVDIQKFIKPFFYVSIVSVVISTYYELLYLQGVGMRADVDTTQYNMDMSYSMLHHVLLITWITLKEFKLWQIPVMMLGVFLLLSLGTRGPILCEIVFAAMYLLFFRPSKYQRLMRAVTIATTIYAFTFIDEFMFMMQGLMLQFGMSTRIFDKYLAGEMDNVDTRNDLTEKLLQHLTSESNTFGYGIHGSYRYVNTYPHNLFLEFWFSFGWLIGSLLLFALFYIIIKALIKSKDENSRVFLILLVCGSIVKLMVSSTFIDEAMFFMLIGYCVNVIRNKNILNA